MGTGKADIDSVEQAQGTPSIVPRLFPLGIVPRNYHYILYLEYVTMLSKYIYMRKSKISHLSGGPTDA